MDFSMLFFLAIMDLILWIMFYIKIVETWYMQFSPYAMKSNNCNTGHFELHLFEKSSKHILHYFIQHCKQGST